jgi:hypothetical protein
MWFNEMCKRWLGRSAKRRTARLGTTRRRGQRLSLEQLEDRTVPSDFTAANVSDLIAEINAANQAGGSNTITLVAPTSSPYVLTAVDNTTDGATGLPVIAANDNLTIIGNGDIIERGTAAGTPAFRLFDVAAGASLRLENVTLQGGLALGYGVSAHGGAVNNAGTFALVGGTVRLCTARGGDGGHFWNISLPGGDGAGGGIYSSGVLQVQGSSIQDDTAVGGRGADAFVFVRSDGHETVAASAGGNGLGGGVFVASGTALISDSTFTGNAASGGPGGTGLKKQLAGKAGLGIGGGLYNDSAASLGLDSFTLANVKKNHASTTDNNIHGSYDVTP